MFELLWPCGDAEFHGERIVEMHMQRLGGKEQLLAQVYSAIATRRDDTVELALRAYGAPEPRSRPGAFTVNVSSIAMLPLVRLGPAFPQIGPEQ